MICVSLVSHLHGKMVSKLAEEILKCNQVDKLIVTLNLPEPFLEIKDKRIQIIQNTKPKGFGANHNHAFNLCKEDYFCIINPDIELITNPFPQMIELIKNGGIGVVAPTIINRKGQIEDSMRNALTPWGLMKRVVGESYDVSLIRQDIVSYKPDWIAGMFMFFDASAYRKIGGFDEKYFMYCEDADICRRLVDQNYSIRVSLSSLVIHDARRASRRNFTHFLWHLRSLLRYFLKYTLIKPKRIS